MIHPFLMQQVEITTLLTHKFEELLAQTTHHITWFLAQHINAILLTNMRYHMKKLMTDGVDDAAI